MQQNADPIWPPYMAFYVQSMLFNTASAVRSIVRLERMFDKLPTEPSIEDLHALPTRMVLDDIQNVVLQSGALSRYFWPSGKQHQARGLQLRRTFDLSDESPLHSRALRNAIEHFDERLDSYFLKGAFGYFFPEYVGVKPEEDGPIAHFFRAYFVDVGVFRLLNEDYEIKPIADEVINLHEQLVARDQPARASAATEGDA